MLTLTARKNVKIALLTLLLSLMFLAEPVLARKVHQKSGKLPQQNLKIRQSPNAGKARKRVTAAEPEGKLRRAKSRERGSFVKSDSRQSRGEKPGRSATRTPGTAPDASNPTTGRFDAVKHARGSFDAGKLAGGNFNALRHARGSFDAGRLTQTGRNRDPIERKIRLEQRLRHLHARSNPGRPYHPDTRRRIYRNPRRRIYRRIVRPSYRRIVYYNHGPRFTFRYFYPYHHRKYVFISLGGYWPLGYSYLRYYRYGYHPYDWYGYYPAVYEVEGDTYNYYTYNYNDGDSAGQVSSGIRPVDENTFADVRERLAAQSAQQPAPETLADRYFEDAVKAFEAGDYDTAADRFTDAIELEPDDMVLPFAYIQALFADRQYSKAAEVLRGAVSRFAPDKQDVFYPRGLYPSDDILFEQIGQLAATAELDPLDEDLQLLLGYQLLGAGELDRAVKPLQRIGPDSENAATAAELLELLEKIKTENTQDTDQ